MTLTVNLNPGLHGNWITRLRERAEVVWATTWEDAANTYLAPLLGIDPLPVAVSTAANPAPDWIVRAADWKASVLHRLYANRPLAWIDDDASKYDRQWYPRTGVATLLIVPAAASGLKPFHLRAVDRFVDENSGPAE